MILSLTHGGFSGALGTQQLRVVSYYASLESYHPLGGALPPASISPLPGPCCFLRSPMSQLYTRAVATSIVCLISVPLQSRIRLQLAGAITYSNLLPQKVQVLLTVGSTETSSFDFRLEQSFGFRQRIRKHYVGPPHVRSWLHGRTVCEPTPSHR